MGQIYTQYLNGSKVFCCSICKTHLSTAENIVSKAFQGLYGRAYLFRKVVNIDRGELTDKQMSTGLHTIQDISCTFCNESLGWCYIKAYEDSEKYKEGMFILEKQLLLSFV